MQPKVVELNFVLPSDYVPGLTKLSLTHTADCAFGPEGGGGLAPRRRVAMRLCRSCSACWAMPSLVACCIPISTMLSSQTYSTWREAGMPFLADTDDLLETLIYSVRSGVATVLHPLSLTGA